MIALNVDEAVSGPHLSVTFFWILVAVSTYWVVTLSVYRWLDTVAATVLRFPLYTLHFLF